MRKLLALSCSLVVGFSGVCQGGVSLHFFGQAPNKDPQPFMFAVSTAHQHQRPGGGGAWTTPGERAAQLHWEDFDAAFWPPYQLNSWLGRTNGSDVGDFLARLADLRHHRQGWQPNRHSASGGWGPTGGAQPVNSGADPGDPPTDDDADHPNGDPGNDPGPAGGPSVVPEPTSGLLWCLAGVLLLVCTRRPR